jgi:hypothetical protein
LEGTFNFQQLHDAWKWLWRRLVRGWQGNTGEEHQQILFDHDYIKQGSQLTEQIWDDALPIAKLRPK